MREAAWDASGSLAMFRYSKHARSTTPSNLAAASSERSGEAAPYRSATSSITSRTTLRLWRTQASTGTSSSSASDGIAADEPRTTAFARQSRVTMHVDEIRRHFPALKRVHRGQPVAYFDGPGG